MLAKRGYPRAPGETPLACADRIAESKPAWAMSAYEITRLCTNSSYDPESQSGDVIQAIRQQVRQF
ncbi:MAG: hypothetical protein CMQ05_11940 [Gammaproteobacteria bacterium]|uniref:Protein-glutamine gamma-glutamyltransferase-like C-terminal domain-containing protein n=1 Tax=OM182 bacterium MED-G24 TaxID=1986255 RepID=A0A2A5WIH3_9GAMM|nr:hypothetical protein [Gammaproteobacteria bacterium]PDH36077.1 MAG: hypothetical protein CNE99_10250 [OM182 bacterium MED-G24]RPG25098.1 MAG: DUF4129 domain-containing protein [Gammaproteobacteria bacterium TMED50]